jgi:hypothetical protein
MLALSGVTLLGCASSAVPSKSSTIPESELAFAPPRIPGPCRGAIIDSAAAVDTLPWARFVAPPPVHLVGPRTPGSLRGHASPARVLLSALIGVDGRVDPTSLYVLSADDRRYASSVCAAAAQTQYGTPLVDGSPHALRVIIPFSFATQSR